MTGPPTNPPPADEHLSIYQRLRERDPTAPDDLASALLQPLACWLAEHNPTIPEEFIHEAAEDAVLALIRNPSSYRPEVGGLESYLRMSAQGDLRNLLRREARHRTRRESWAVVELSDRAGNYPGREEDPSLRLQI